MVGQLRQEYVKLQESLKVLLALVRKFKGSRLFKRKRGMKVLAKRPVY